MATDILFEYEETHNEKCIRIIIEHVVLKIKDANERADMLQNIARNNGGLASKYYVDCDLDGIPLDKKIAILVDAIKNDPVGTMGYLRNYKLEDLRGLCVNGFDAKADEKAEEKNKNKVTPEDMLLVIAAFLKAGKDVKLPPYDEALNPYLRQALIDWDHALLGNDR